MITRNEMPWRERRKLKTMKKMKKKLKTENLQGKKDQRPRHWLFLFFFFPSLSLSLSQDCSLLTGLNRFRGIIVARESNRTHLPQQDFYQLHVRNIVWNVLKFRDVRRLLLLYLAKFEIYNALKHTFNCIFWNYNCNLFLITMYLVKN